MQPLRLLKRQSDTWSSFVEAHAAFGADEQLSLTAATGGRTLGLEKKWNLFPKLHIADGEVPEGVVHWLGWPKPWHPDAEVWRPDIWEAERSSWEHLRMGLWRKPLSLELEPEDDAAVRALVRRGWRVKVFSSRFASGEGLEPGFPDLEALPVGDFQRELEREAADQVRLGAWEDAGEWLEGARRLPEHLVLRGGVDADEVDRVRRLGYEAEARLMSGEWPEGGPLPRVLEHGACAPGTGAGPGEDLYLKAPVGWCGGPLSLGRKPVRPKQAGGRKVGLCVIATANYRMYARPLLRSVRANFLPEHEVMVFLFTDGKMDEAPGLRVIPVEHQPWPGMAIRRYPIFTEHAEVFDEMEYLYYLDVDMRVIGKVGGEIFGELVGTRHPGFHDKARREFTYEHRSESAAYVWPGEGVAYFCGAFQGGSRTGYLEAARVMSERIEADAAKGITAVWHDESHWNRYLIDREPEVVLSPSYCWYPDGRSKDFEGKIAVVLKDAEAMRAG